MKNIIEVLPTAKKSFGKAKMPGSKSYTNRALLMAALADGTSTLTNTLESDDTEAMIQALRILGVKIIKKNKSLIVHGRGGKFMKPNKIIDVKNSGTTMRFLTAVLSTQNFASTLTGNKRMQQRPIKDLINSLKNLDVKIDAAEKNIFPPVIIKGSGMKGGKTYIKADTSSQYVSALLMAAPYAEKEVILEVKGQITSLPYIQMTLQIMNNFGVKVKHDKHFKSFKIPLKKYHAQNISIENDASAATYAMSLAALHGGQITIQDLSLKSLQADLKFIDVLKKFGCKIYKGKNFVQISGPKKLRPLGKINLNDLPDAAMTVAMLAAFAEGKSQLSGLTNLRFKESDRLHALTTELQKIGADVKEEKNGLTINGDPQNLHGAIIETYDDHRLAMCFAVIGSKIPHIKITDPECVNKTYPNFWKDFSKLGIKTKKLQTPETIILCGMRGTGKSTLGKTLAKKLHWEFIDTDSLIEKQENKKISTIVLEHGWKYFRKLEHQIAKKLASRKRVVISTGGGFFTNKKNVKLMQSRGEIILLLSNLETIHRRIKAEPHRPELIKNSSLKNELNAIWFQRKKSYTQAADFWFDTSSQTKSLKKDMNKKADQILDHLTSYNLLKK